MRAECSLRRMALAALLVGFAGVLSSPLPLVWAADRLPQLDRDPEPLRPETATEAKATGPSQTASGDTVWIADWTFDLPGGGCDGSGWTKLDNRILNDGSNYWTVDARFDGTGGITGQAAILSKHDLLWAEHDGYGNDWDYSIVCQYRGTGATLSFDFLSDSEPTFDFVRVEADSAGASEVRTDFALNPKLTAEDFRDLLVQFDGLHSPGVVSGLVLPDYGVPAATHEVYIRLTSDGGYSDEDGLYPSAWGAGAVVDSIVVTGDIAYTEEFEGALNATRGARAQGVVPGVGAAPLRRIAHDKPMGVSAGSDEHRGDFGVGQQLMVIGHDSRDVELIGD